MYDGEIQGQIKIFRNRNEKQKKGKKNVGIIGSDQAEVRCPSQRIRLSSLVLQGLFVS